MRMPAGRRNSPARAVPRPNIHSMDPFERRVVIYALAGLAMARSDRRTS
jgi:hypothetical protein